MKHSRQTDAYARRGLAALEFALVLPFVALLMLGGADITFWLIKKFRLDDAATAVGNIVAAANNLPASAFPASYCASTSTSLNYFAVAYSVASPMSVCGTNGATIISGITNDGTTTLIVWQERSGDSGAYPSRFGIKGGTPSFPSGYTVPSGHSVITTELYTGISPWSFSRIFMGGIGSTSLYAYSVFEPRFGKLSTPN